MILSYSDLALAGVREGGTRPRRKRQTEAHYCRAPRRKPMKSIATVARSIGLYGVRTASG